MQLLLGNGLGTSTQLVPSAAMAHSKKIDGICLNSADVRTLLSNLLEVGFVAEWTRCRLSNQPMIKSWPGLTSSSRVARGGWVR